MKFRRWTVAAVLAVLAVAVLPGGAGQPKPIAPVCAFLDPERAPRAALLEARLLADASVTWVERAAIDKVLAEQRLAAFGPQGGADRVRLGKLLKADLLVLVRPAQEAREPLSPGPLPRDTGDGATLEVVVSDTSRGVRLAVRTVAVSKDADADVAALCAAVRFGLAKHGEEAREVVTVPPFASTNLEYAHEHLKGAYAKLVEQAALARPGVVVVELAEAEAIARELKLSDPSGTVKRPLPLYLLGEFRHEGRGADLQVELQLRVSRGGLPVGKTAAQRVAPTDAPAVLRQWTLDRLAAGQAGQAAVANPKAEAQQLAELSRLRQRVGDWNDALALLEASLLLDPHQPDLNADAMVLLRVQSARLLERGTREIDLLRRAAGLHRRGMEHMETLVVSGAKLPRFAEGPQSVRGGRMFSSPFPFPSQPIPYTPFPPPNDPPEVKELIRELLRESRAAALRLLPLIVKSGTAHEVVIFMGRALWDLPLTEQYEERARLILQYQEFPAMKAAVNSFTELAPHTLELDQLPIHRQWLDGLEKAGNAYVRSAAAQARQQLPGVEKQMIGLAKRAADQKQLIDELVKKNAAKQSLPARLTKREQAEALEKRLEGGPLRSIGLKGATPDDDWFKDHLRGVIAAGPGIDVFYSWGTILPDRSKDNSGRPKPGVVAGKTGPVLLVMKQPGLFHRAWGKPGAPDRYTSVCFDGRYVWIAVEGSRQAPALFVFDPVAEKGYEVTADDGLPQPPEELAKDPRRTEPLALVVAPLEPGRVCLAGSFGRAWVGLARFDAASGKAAVTVIHEARERPRQGELAQDLWQNRHLTFVPMHAHTLRGQPDARGKTPVRVLIGRSPTVGTNDNTMKVAWHPLVVDPDGLTVEVLRGELYSSAVRNSAAEADGSLLIAFQPPSTPDKARLLRVEYPGTVRDLGPLDITKLRSLGPVGMSKERLHFALTTPGPGGKWFGSTFWSGDLDGRNLAKVAEDMPHIRNFARSAHYGLVAWCDLYPGVALCAVEAPVAPGK